MSTAAGEWGCGDSWDEVWQRLREHTAHMTGHRSRSRRGPFGPPWAAWGTGWGTWANGPQRPRAAKGDVRLALLALLAESPRHGYQLIQDIAQRSHGQWTPSPGSVYPALSALQDEGLIDDEKIEGRRVFSLTDAGREYVATHKREVEGVFRAFDDAEPPAGAEDLSSLLVSVGAAAMQVIAAGKAEEAERILGRTRRELFAVLAADEEE